MRTLFSCAHSFLIGGLYPSNPFAFTVCFSFTASGRVLCWPYFLSFWGCDVPDSERGRCEHSGSRARVCVLYNMFMKYTFVNSNLKLLKRRRRRTALLAVLFLLLILLSYAVFGSLNFTPLFLPHSCCSKIVIKRHFHKHSYQKTTCFIFTQHTLGRTATPKREHSASTHFNATL